MSNLTIGDRVRLLHGKEEGIVKKISKDGLIEVEIEDGFCIPVLRSELAVVATTEQQYFKSATKPAASKANESKPIPRAEKGIYLALSPIREATFSVYLINNTDWQLPFSLSMGSLQNNSGVMAGCLLPKTHQLAAKELRMTQFDDWSVVNFQTLYHQNGHFTQKNAYTRQFRIRPNSFFNEKKSIPLVGGEGYIVQLDAVEAPVSIKPQELKENMLTANEPVYSVSSKDTKPYADNQAIDLHIEKLNPQALGLASGDIITIQLAAFERNLEQAIASSVTQITFIHGVGNGVLRQEIHRRLAKNTHVAWFRDAQKEKFGYGATLVQLK